MSRGVFECLHGIFFMILASLCRFNFSVILFNFKHAWKRIYTDLTGQGLTVVLLGPYIYGFKHALDQ